MATLNDVKNAVEASNQAINSIDDGVNIEDIDITEKLFDCSDRLASAWQTENGENAIIALNKVINYLKAPVNSLKGSVDLIKNNGKLKADETLKGTGRYVE